MDDESRGISEDEHISPTVCFLCRQRKTKCDRKLPQCGFCAKAQVECQYVEQTKKRGLRAGYVTQLEDRLDVLEREFKRLKNNSQHQHAGLSPSISHRSSSCHVAATPDLSSPIRPVSHSSLQNDLDPHSAVRDMMSLSHDYYHHLADSWFKETQMWVPILNREHIQASLNVLPMPVDRIEDIELRALVAFQTPSSTQAICLGYKGRRRLSRYLRSQVLVDAMAQPSMSSLRALVIIAILDYGSDDIPSTFSLLAVCRRMCENIGLFRQLLTRIEGEAPAQVGPPAANMPSTEDAIPLTWCILALDAVSTLGVTWRDVSAALVDHLSSVAFISTPDFRDSFRTHVHLAAIGLQPVHEFFCAQARHTNTTEDPLEACEDMFQNLMSYVDGLPETSYTLLADGAVDFDICQIFTRILSHGTIMLIYQRFVFHDDERVADLSRQRCMSSCGRIIDTLRSISDADSEVNNSPLVATMAFVAARFKLAFYRATTQPREPLFDILMHGINMLGRRWQYARRLDIVLRAAIAELETESPSALPGEFWDLGISHVDISELLKTWVGQHKPSLYIGNLDGPYV